MIIQAILTSRFLNLYGLIFIVIVGPIRCPSVDAEDS
jgi:hypothetical protein